MLLAKRNVAARLRATGGGGRVGEQNRRPASRARTPKTVRFSLIKFNTHSDRDRRNEMTTVTFRRGNSVRLARAAALCLFALAALFQAREARAQWTTSGTNTTT